MTKSGTSTFEIAMQGVPEVICYRTSPVNYYLAKAFVGLKNVGMPNIIEGNTIVPELIQNGLTKERLAYFIKRYIEDEGLYRGTRKKFLRLREKMGELNTSEEVVSWIKSML